MESVVLIEETGRRQGKQPWAFAPSDMLWEWNNAPVIQPGESWRVSLDRAGVGAGGK